MKILVVDDAPEIIEAVTLSFNLQWRECEVLGVGDGHSALEAIECQSPDLVLLDIGLPDLDGYEVLRRIREFSDVPVIMLTVREAVLDRVKGLELGADDYITKPFDHLELLARVKAVLRRLALPQPDSRAASFVCGDVEVNFTTRSLYVGGQPVPLTPIEYKLLYHLVRNAGVMLRHETLLARVWGREYTDEIDYLRVYIRRLRQKIGDDPEHPRYIFTERGLGYRFRNPLS